MEENERVSKPRSRRGQYYEREISKERFQSQRTNVADLTAARAQLSVHSLRPKQIEAAHRTSGL